MYIIKYIVDKNCFQLYLTLAYDHIIIFSKVLITTVFCLDTYERKFSILVFI